MKPSKLCFRLGLGLVAVATIILIFLGAALCSAWEWWHFGPSGKIYRFLSRHFGTLPDAVDWWRKLRDLRRRKGRSSILLLLLLVAGVAHAEPPRRFLARVTYYEPRSCPYGNVTSTGRYAVEGVTCAVDPRVIPYGSRVRVLALEGVVGDGWFLAQDTGSAVKRRKASRKWGSNAPVVDIFVSSPKRLRSVEREAPMFCMVEVHP